MRACTLWADYVGWVEPQPASGDPRTGQKSLPVLTPGRIRRRRAVHLIRDRHAGRINWLAVSFMARRRSHEKAPIGCLAGPSHGTGEARMRAPQHDRGAIAPISVGSEPLPDGLFQCKSFVPGGQLGIPPAAPVAACCRVVAGGGSSELVARCSRRPGLSGAYIQQ